MKPSLTVKPKLLVVAIALTLNSGSLWAACSSGMSNDLLCTTDVDIPHISESVSKTPFIGIKAMTAVSSSEIENDVEISTGGDGEHALHEVTGEGPIDIVNSGSLTTSGLGSKGILAESNGAGKITITNNADITTQSQNHIIQFPTTPESHGIQAINSSTGASGGITIDHTGGTITTSAYNSSAIRAESSASTGDINISSTNALLNVNGIDSDGIVAVHTTAMNETSTANINITTRGGSIKVLDAPIANLLNKNIYSHGIEASIRGVNSGDINIIVDKTEISVGTHLDGKAPLSHAIDARIDNLGSGNIDIKNSGKLTTVGATSSLIFADNQGSGGVTITNSGELSMLGRSIAAVNVQTNSGDVIINNSGSVTSSGDMATAIYGGSFSGNVSVINSGEINFGGFGTGIMLSATKGNSSLFSTGNITSDQDNSGKMNTFGNQAIMVGASDGGNALVSYDKGTIASVGSGDGIRSWDEYSGTGASAKIILGADAVVDASRGLSGIVIGNNNKGNISIAAGAVVHGGDRKNDLSSNQIDIHQVAGVRFTGEGTPDFVLDNAGVIDSMNDVVLVNELHNFVAPGATLAGTLLVNNTGTMTGYMILSDEDTTFNNFSSNGFNLRNFTDADSDGVRDTKSIAISDFGGGNDVFNNQTSGSLRLSAVNTELHTDTTGEYLVSGALSTANKGTVQGQLLNLNRFVNSGLIDLTENNQAGDVLIISGGSTAGAYGGAQYISNGGTLALDTVLNEGGVNSLSDILVLDDAVTGTSATKLAINHVSGEGALTQGNGIKLVEVLGTSDSDAFTLNAPVKAGRYEYVLNQGATDQNWYLSNTEPPVVTPPVDPINPPTPKPEENQKPIYNSDIGAYLANQTAATQMFMHSLHDRAGEPQYTEGLKQEGRVPSVWLRLVANHTKSEAASGYFDQRANSSVVHLGGELAQWSNSGDSRFHMGIMGAYGKTESHTTGSYTKSRSNGKVDGYGAGAYLTWFENESLPTGAYVDVWSMYGWFNNEVNGSNKYDSNTWTNSVEAGYASIVTEGERFQWMIEPQAQVLYTHYSADDYRDVNGLSVSGNDASGIATRLGARTYMRNKVDKNNAQPFIEVNWLYGDAKNSLDFNGQRMSEDRPKNKLETKFGLQGQVTDGLQVYSHIGLQWGKDSYERSEAQIGVKYSF